MQKDPNIISTRAENRPPRKPKNSFTSPLEQSKTATEHNLWSHRAHAQPMQTPCRHCRCKKTQTSSRHEPKTAHPANQKTLSRHLWNNLKQPQSTIFGATEHMPSLCKHHVDTADAKRPKHRAQTPKTSKLLGALPLCEGVGGFFS